MSYSLNAVTAPDTPDTASTIQDVPITNIMLDVANQAIYWQLQIRTNQSSSSGVWESTSTYMLPGSRIISSDRNDEITGIRFWAATPAANLPTGTNQATVTVRTDP